MMNRRLREDGIETVGSSEADKLIDCAHRSTIRVGLLQIAELLEIAFNQDGRVPVADNQGSRVRRELPIPCAELHAPAVALRKCLDDARDDGIEPLLRLHL